ncbi:MAG: hypothetical protein ABIG29_01195 [Candidatus Nealsonbacteria bacterium]
MVQIKKIEEVKKVSRDTVFKYGPSEPSWTPPPSRLMIIKYGPPEPRPPIFDKYAPIEPCKPGVKPKEKEDKREKEIQFISNQITECLKKIEKLLEKIELLAVRRQNIDEVNIELGSCIAELALLHAKLSDLQKPVENVVMEMPRGKTDRGFIAYIVTAPARPTKKE